MRFWNWFTFRNKSPAFDDFDDLIESAQKIYLKSLAIDKSAELMARLFSKAEFLFLKDGERVFNPWSYLINVKPNLAEGAARFWQRVVYRLIVANEVLIVLSDDDQLLVADSYIRREYALYEERFESVVVKDYQFKRSFARSDVIFIQYNNGHLDRYLGELFDDYHKLHNRMVESLARNNQIRGTLNIKGASQFTAKQTETLKKYSERLFTAFKDRSVAIVPMIDQVDYAELTNKTATANLSVEELKRLKYQFEDEVANLIGIPTVLLHGDVAGIEQARQSFVSDCLKPLIKKVVDELTANFISAYDYHQGYRLEISHVIERDLLDLSSNIDKVVSSGAFRINEVRHELGYEPIEEGHQIIRTKNYEVTETAKKGGENETD
ncbi:phage portal protein [Streptococcus sp. sy004]|uniref:phage portal protein n=1 Tax=Streptococcus sp. sy004 TaxID=2600149 RepID=UPI0011B74FEC|nr:phage portal protein [Streptococcus sp. sy004]TWT12068.1 phage portal protein [Streptococcus sp. sy004]